MELEEIQEIFDRSHFGISLHDIPTIKNFINTQQKRIEELEKYKSLYEGSVRLHDKDIKRLDNSVKENTELKAKVEGLKILVDKAYNYGLKDSDSKENFEYIQGLKRNF